ncbi:MAG: hypothetical protein WCI05_16970 [Myxococcales bacterium]
MNQRHIVSLAVTVAILGMLGACKKKIEDDDLAVRRTDNAPSAVATSNVPTPAASVPVAAAEREVTDITLEAVVSARASSFHQDADPFNPPHPPIHAFDQNPNTAWNHESPTDGTGEWLEARLKPNTFVGYVEVSGGWAAMSGRVDLWSSNSSFRVMRVNWDGGSALVKFDRKADRGNKKRVDINKVTTTLRFTAVEVDTGKWKDLCVDDINIYGEAGESLCPRTLEPSCPSGLFVQMAMPLAMTPATYDYPLAQLMLRGKKDFSGIKLIETRRNGKRVMGALVPNRCIALKLVEITNENWHANAQSMCEAVVPTRVVLELP